MKPLNVFRRNVTISTNNQNICLKSLKVKYTSGLSNLSKATKAITMELFSEGFRFYGNNFPELWIPHSSVSEFKISRDGLSLWKSSTVSYFDERMIDIFYLNNEGEKVTIKVEIPPPPFIFVPFTVREELKAVMNEHNIFDKFASAQVANPSDEILSQIEKLAEMHKSGILTDEEFQAKKAELLSRI